MWKCVPHPGSLQAANLPMESRWALESYKELQELDTLHQDMTKSV